MASVKGMLEEHVEEIDALYQKLDEVNEKINTLRKKTPCPVCGCQNEENALFCSHCGVKLKYNEQSATAGEAVPQEEKTSGSAHE